MISSIRQTDVIYQGNLQNKAQATGDMPLKLIELYNYVLELLASENTQVAIFEGLIKAKI